MTNKEMAARLAAIQEDAYKRFHVSSLPQDADTLDDMSEWTLDQIRKVSFADMLNEDVLDMLDDGSLSAACLATYLGLER
nr:MAG TPA: hypothetical protein [Caudoviricetes sp.]